MWIWAGIGMLLAVSGLAQDVNITPRVRGKNPDKAETAVDRRADIRVDTTLVLVPVAVLDPRRKFVTGLDKENFTVYEDKVEQKIATFSSEDAPLSIGIVFDTSGSMGSKLDMSRKAVAQFMKVANPEDEFFLVEFGKRPELVQPFTTAPEVIQDKLLFVKSQGTTALLDGVYMAMNAMRKARNPRKAILIISDGGDNASRYTQTEVKNAVVEADVQVYGMGIFEPIASRSRTPEEFSGPEMLNQLANLTGGRSFGIGNLAELPDVAEKIAIELRNQYVLGYSPGNKVRDGKYRRVEVKLSKVRGLPPLKPIFRTGYYAPVQ
jgi:VWFA-related protein